MSSLPTSAVSRHRLLPENGDATMAKANLRKADEDWRRDVGQAIKAASDALGWSLKEFAAKVGKDERQCARWMDGSERPQFDVLFAVAALREPLVIAIAALAGAGVSIETVITVRRSA
jgi:ribosome-binding protein aMBF1 (putative translation factor)